MEYGEYIQKLLLERSVVLSDLCQRIGLKSRNELYRLFYNQHSYEKAKEITNKIIENVDFTEEEKATIYNKLEKINVKSSVVDSRGILSRIFDHDFDRDGKGNPSADRQTDIYVGSFKELVNADYVYDYIKNQDGRASLTHFVAFTGSEKDIAKELYSILLFSCFKKYNIYLTSKRSFDALCIISSTRARNKLLLKVRAKRQTMTLNTDINRETSTFIKNYFDLNKGRSIRRNYDKLTDYSERLNKLSNQFHTESIAVCGGMYLCRIPYDIMFKIFKDSGFLGLPADSEYVRNILDAYKARWNDECSRRFRRRLILDYDMVNEFVETGRTFDHPTNFRSLTRSEILATLEALQKDFDTSGGLKIYRFINGKVNRNIVYSKEYGIGIHNSGPGYSDGNYGIAIDTKKACDVFEDFIEYIWDTRTFGDEDSRVILRKLILKAKRQLDKETA